MSKIKDTIEEEKIFADKELEVIEPGYKFDESKHYHSLDSKPLLGCSTVVGVIAKPLTWWASGLAVAKLGWTNSKLRVDGKYKTIPLSKRIEHLTPFWEKIKKLDTNGFLNLLDEAYKAHAEKLDKAADEGTDLHAELERYVKWHMSGEKENRVFDPKIIPFIRWTEENVDKFLWSEIHCYSKELWVGGISDVGVLLKNGKAGVLDFKSSKDSYDSQFIQCAGYDLLISENGGFDSKGRKSFELQNKIEFYAVVPFGAPKFTVDFRYNVEELREGFKSAVVLYKLTNK